jgi:8-oxo-dGTP diphosphatase
MTAAGPPRVTRVSAYAVCTDPSDRLLLCRIAPGATVRFDGWWTLPGGGLEHGEHPRAGALRELTEETGLIGEIESLLDVDSWHSIYTGLDGVETDFHGVRILYRCRITGGDLRDEPDGTTDTCRWFGPDELPTDRLVDIAELAVRLVL